MKPGLQTTEFWVTVLTDVGLIAASIAGSLPDKWAAIGAAVSTVAYSIARGLAKNGTTTPGTPAA